MVLWRTVKLLKAGLQLIYYCFRLSCYPFHRMSYTIIRLHDKAIFPVKNYIRYKKKRQFVLDQLTELISFCSSRIVASKKRADNGLFLQGSDQFSCIQGLPVLQLICFIGELSHRPFFIQLELNFPAFLESP